MANREPLFQRNTFFYIFVALIIAFAVEVFVEPASQIFTHDAPRKEITQTQLVDRDSRPSAPVQGPQVTEAQERSPNASPKESESRTEGASSERSISPRTSAALEVPKEITPPKAPLANTPSNIQS